MSSDHWRPTSQDFAAMDRVRQNRPMAAVSTGGAVNALLKAVFRTLCGTAHSQQPQSVADVERAYPAQLDDTFAP